MIYINFEVYSMKREEITNKVRELYRAGQLSMEDVYSLTLPLFDMIDKGSIGDYEIFKGIRDKIEGDRLL